jgi:D-alanine transaminase
MPRISYVNGQYRRHGEAAVSIEDRGFQFADGVYEVLPIMGGRLFHMEQHLDRLGRSLAALRMAWPVGRQRVLPLICAEVARRNRVVNGLVYIQITRGVARRNHLFPADTNPTLVVSAWSQKGPSPAVIEAGVAVVTCADQRWKRPDIKAVGLLPNVLAKQAAAESGAFEAWMVDGQGHVTEGCATNAFIITKDGVVVTHPADTSILGGVTRANVLDLARQAGITVMERLFTVAEAKDAAEAFMTGTTMMVLPVVSIDGSAIGDGRPGPITRRLRNLYCGLRAQ